MAPVTDKSISTQSTFIALNIEPDDDSDDEIDDTKEIQV